MSHIKKAGSGDRMQVAKPTLVNREQPLCIQASASVNINRNVSHHAADSDSVVYLSCWLARRFCNKSKRCYPIAVNDCCRQPRRFRCFWHGQWMRIVLARWRCMTWYLES